MNAKVQNILKVFAIRSIITFAVWMIAYHGYIEPDGRANEWLTTKVVQGTRVGLNLLGYNTNSSWRSDSNEDSARYIYIDGQPVVLVADPCNGLELMALFIGFIICFPGKSKFKLVIIPIGTLLVFLLNVFREMVLALNYKYFQESFEFNHKYTYVLIVYSFIFLMWRFWLNNYSQIGKKAK